MFFFSRFFRWSTGDRGYEVIRLVDLTWPFRFDCGLTRFGPKVMVPWHIDKVPGMVHYRLNITLRHAILGGEFESDHVIFDFWRFRLYRSDHPHTIHRVEIGTKYVLSAGIYLPNWR